MFPVNYDQHPQVADQMNTYRTLPLTLVVLPDIKLYKLLADLSPDTPWGNRKIAAEKLGSMRSPDSLPGLLDALPTDSFWMVRCAIIQALEKIGDPDAIPTLQEIENSDGFQVVRSYATKAIERLSQRVGTDMA
ncbi:HEAT repeat domain-containing protein [Chloroflexota bacterium]